MFVGFVNFTAERTTLKELKFGAATAGTSRRGGWSTSLKYIWLAMFWNFFYSDQPNFKQNPLSKASLTSHRTCMYVLVIEKIGLICKVHLSYIYEFITEYQGHRDSAMKWLQTSACLKENLREA